MQPLPMRGKPDETWTSSVSSLFVGGTSVGGLSRRRSSPWTLAVALECTQRGQAGTLFSVASPPLPDSAGLCPGDLVLRISLVFGS